MTPQSNAGGAAIPTPDPACNTCTALLAVLTQKPLDAEAQAHVEGR